MGTSSTSFVANDFISTHSVRTSCIFPHSHPVRPPLTCCPVLSAQPHSMYSYRFASIKESFHAGAEGPSPSPDDRWPSVVETLNPANAHTLISTPIRYVSQRVPSRWIIKPTGTGRPTNRSSITPVPPHSIFFFEDPSDSFGQYPGLILFMDIVDLVRHDKVTFARFQGWHIAHPTLVRMTGELVLEAALVDVPVTAVDHTTLRAMSRLPFTFLRGLVRAHFQ